MARTVKRWFHFKDGTIEQHDVPADRKVWKLPRALEEQQLIVRERRWREQQYREGRFNELTFHMVPISNESRSHLWEIFFEQ